MQNDHDRRITLERLHVDLQRMQALDARFPGEQMFKSIILQLEHVIRCIETKVSPFAGGKELNFGFLGMKFVYEFSEDLGGELAEIYHVIEVNYK